MKKFTIITCFAIGLGGTSLAQFDIDRIPGLEDILGKVMVVKKGFDPKFFLGKTPIPKINKLGEIFGLKQNEDINKLFRTFKTGRTVYKVAAYAGGAIVLYGAIRAVDKAAAAKDYKGALVGGLTTIGTGVITKLLTKGASYKAVDIFNGVVRKKIKDIFSVQPASATMGVGIYVKL